jgi:hypothetical protein
MLILINLENINALFMLSLLWGTVCPRLPGTWKLRVNDGFDDGGNPEHSTMFEHNYCVGNVLEVLDADPCTKDTVRGKLQCTLVVAYFVGKTGSLVLLFLLTLSVYHSMNDALDCGIFRFCRACGGRRKSKKSTRIGSSSTTKDKKNESKRPTKQDGLGPDKHCTDLQFDRAVQPEHAESDLLAHVSAIENIGSNSKGTRAGYERKRAKELAEAHRRFLGNSNSGGKTSRVGRGAVTAGGGRAQVTSGNNSGDLETSERADSGSGTDNDGRDENARLARGREVVSAAGKNGWDVAEHFAVMPHVCRIEMTCAVTPLETRWERYTDSACSMPGCLKEKVSGAAHNTQ